MLRSYRLIHRAVSFFAVILPISGSIGQISVTGDLNRVYTVESGGMYRGTIEIVNVGKEPKEVKVYQNDYLFFSDGTNRYDDPGTTPRSNANWIEFGPRQFVVPGEDRVIVNYEIRVPEADSLIGTYWSMLMVEPTVTVDPETYRDKLGVIAVVRYGIQIIANIGDSGVRNLRFFDAGLIEEAGKLLLQIKLENNGQRELKPQLWVEVWRADGQSAGKFEGPSIRIYPGTSVTQRVDVSPLQPGDYQAMLVADCGGEDLFGYNLKFQILMN